MIVSKEEAELKARKCGNNIKLLEWNGPSQPAKAQCLDCGEVFDYKVGGKIYQLKNDGRTVKKCKCKYKYKSNQLDNINEFIFKKNIDKSTFKYGITVPKVNEKDFLRNIKSETIERGQSHQITLIFNDYKTECRVTSPDRKGTAHEVLQIRYDSNKGLKRYLLELFRYTEEEIENKEIEMKGSLEFYSTEQKDVFKVKANRMKNINDKYKTDKDKIRYVQQYITSKGYEYDYELVSNLYISLKTKPFVILAGISGTGKSKIVRLFAESLGATVENHQFNMISVRPDWNDSTELIGYKNLESKFIKGKLTQIIEEASQNLDKPYFVCLDEMNLARVEYYLSDYLSVIESRRKVNDKIVTDKLIYDSEIDEEETLSLPENLYIVGTVNMDDTTFQFSRKVLDRANTIEFSEVNLENLFGENSEEGNLDENIEVYNDFLKSTYLKTIDIEDEYRDYAIEINKKIIDINNILKKSQKQFAYRVRDEILFYMIENKKVNLLDENEAFDYQIMQKVLPTISGSENSVKETLVNLFNFVCEKEILNDSDIEEAEQFLNSQDIKYKKSAEKIIYMLKGYNYDGYASYWY